MRLVVVGILKTYARQSTEELVVAAIDFKNVCLVGLKICFLVGYGCHGPVVLCPTKAPGARFGNEKLSIAGPRYRPMPAYQGVFITVLRVILRAFVRSKWDVSLKT